MLECLSSSSQTNRKDSLILASFSATGKTKADLYNAISKAYWFTNHDSSVYFAERALETAKELKYKRAEGEAYRNIGMANMHVSVDSSKLYFYRALTIFIELNDQKGIADTYNNLGTMWSEKNNAAALICYDSALTIFRSIHDKKGEGAVLNYINITYKSMGDFQNAIDYALQGLEVRKSTNDHEGIIYSLLNVGDIYYEGGQLESALKFYNESLNYARQFNIRPFPMSYERLGKTYLTLKQYEKAKNFLQIIPADKNHLLLGQLYEKMNQPDSAFDEFKYASEIFKSHDDKANLAGAYVGLSRIYLKKNNLEKSRIYAKLAFDMAASSKNRITMAEAGKIISLLEETSGKYKDALYFSRMSSSIFDSLNNKTNESYQRKLAAFESKSAIEKEQANVRILSAEKELQQQKLNSEKLYRNIILITSVVIILFSFITIRNINGKRKKILLQKEQIDWQKLKVEKAYEELKSTQSQLIRREKMASLGELTAGIAHEIQNPLNFVNNFSEVSMELVDEINEEEKKEIPDHELVLGLLKDIGQNLQKITHHGHRADAIVKGMLQHSRSNSGKKIATNINALVDEYARLSYHGLRAKDKSFNVAIKTDFDQRIQSANIVPEDIGRVILNLLNNAFYSTMEKMRNSNGSYEPLVSVCTRLTSMAPGEHGVEIRIRDNGIGITEKILDKIYYPFFTTKPTGQGTGLGLSLSYDIVTKGHNGNLRVETTENEFAEFIIDLPLQ